MKKSIKKLEQKAIKNIPAVKGGTGPKTKIIRRFKDI